MRLDSEWDRKHRLADIVVVLGFVCLATATWACLAAAGTQPWKAYASVMATLFLALAALTRDVYWAVWIRLLMSVWVIAAPYVLAFSDVAAAQRIYIAVGVLMAVLSMPGMSWIMPWRADPRGAVWKTE